MAEKESKKRKRVSNGVPTPSKKVAIDPAAGGDGTITVSYVDEEGLKPILLSAPGVNAPTIPFNAYAKASSAKAKNGIIKPKTHHILLQSSQHPRLDYTAATNTLEPSLLHYVAVFDPATSQLRVTPAHFLSLRSTLRSEKNDVEQNKLSYAQKREELGREFGTKKAKRAIASKTENAITSDVTGESKITEVQSAILQSVGDATAGAASRDSQAETDTLLAAKPIPRPNLAADKVEDVYTYATLLPPNDARLVEVKDWQELARAEEAIMFNHRYPSTRAAALGKSDDISRLKALRYLTLLLQFHDALGNTRGGKKIPKRESLMKKLAGWPPQLVDSVRQRFASESGHELGKWQLDNLYTHICALALFVDGWATPTNQLKDDLKMEPRQLAQYFMELGCKVSALTETERNVRRMNKAIAAVTKMAKLKLPLEFPKPRYARRR